MSLDPGSCLKLKLVRDTIVVTNACDAPIRLEALEIRYYVTGALAVRPATREEEELKRARRVVSERISIGTVLEPRASTTIFFGVTENIVEVKAEASANNKKVRVTLYRS